MKYDMFKSLCYLVDKTDKHDSFHAYAREQIQRLRDREIKLVEAIKNHRSKTGHNMCWENDEELWSILDDGIQLDHTPPGWSEFITRCAQYRASKEN